jgi:hypothetical protein
MLSTDIKQESIIKRIEQVVSILMAEYPLFKDDLDYSEIVKHLVKLFRKIYYFKNLIICQIVN